jgi:ATP-dependent exoDNAse (exonuclease V) beta subunit
VVKRAAERERWRETYVGTIQEDGIVLEGFVDLIYREDDGSLVIVDYKTDAIPAGAVETRAADYRPQLDTYARAHQDAGAVRPRTRLLFLYPGGAGVAAR